jgi:hypothetical protein
MSQASDDEFELCDLRVEVLGTRTGDAGVRIHGITPAPRPEARPP